MTRRLLSNKLPRRTSSSTRRAPTIGLVSKVRILRREVAWAREPNFKPATLEGLEKNSAARPGNPPLYIHVSGCGIISDNCRGEKVDNVKEWSDIGLDLKEYVCTSNTSGVTHLFGSSCPPTNTHLESDMKVSVAQVKLTPPACSHKHQIVEAGTREENPIRSIIIYPCQIYGVGRGMSAP